MLRSFQNLRSIVTIFHSPASAASKNLVAFVRKTYPDPATRSFDIEITEKNPTPEQSRSILTALGLKEASGEKVDDQDLIKRGIVKPILIAWDAGKAAANDDVKAKSILAELAKTKPEQ